jgi:hypothetical protein
LRRISENFWSLKKGRFRADHSHGSAMPALHRSDRHEDGTNMLRRSEKQDRKWMGTEEVDVPFFDPDAPETVATVAGELRERMLTVEQKVLAQYAASAAYATIAQQNVDTARAEARADLDRMERRLTNLVEQRAPRCGPPFPAPRCRSMPPPASAPSRSVWER